MKIVRFLFDNKVRNGILEGDKVKEIKGDIFSEYTYGNEIAKEEIKLLPPVNPPNIIAIGLNYKNHAKESNSKIPEKPIVFLKATTSLVGSGRDIKLPQMAPDKVDYEAELAVVIGDKAKNVNEEEASDYVLGYTCGNDVSARDCQKGDRQWARAKSFDTFCPLGPWIETNIKPDNLQIKTILNGEIMQDSNTSDMIFKVKELVSYLSKIMTLLPGTIIMTGTPEGVGFTRKDSVYLRSGDNLKVEIEGIGILNNNVV